MIENGRFQGGIPTPARRGSGGIVPPAMSTLLRAALVLTSLALAACSTTGAQAPSPATPGTAGTPAAEAPNVESVEILARDEVTEKASVKHILISWGELGPSLNRQQDPRASDRSRAAAGALITEIAKRAEEGEDFEQLMSEYSEDAGSSQNAMAYPVTRDAQLAFMFRRLALRLEPGEQGVVKTQFGYHLILRVE